MERPQERYETVAGCRVHMLRGGSGPPLLFLHGARGVTGWWPIFRTLSERYDVIAPDHPGFGRSDTPDWLDSVGDLAFFYLDFIAALGLDGVHLVGSSLGGWIAAELAVRNTARLRTVHLIAPAGVAVPGVPFGEFFLWDPEEAVRNLYADQRLADVLLSFAASEAETRRQIKNQVSATRLAWRPRFHNPDLPKWLHRIDRPTQLIWGDGDKVIPAAIGPVYQSLIPASRLEVLPDCGHVPHIEKPHVVVSLIDRLCSACDG